MTEFRLADYELDERNELIEDLREQFERVTDAYEDLRRELADYNRLVKNAEAFVESKLDQVIDSYTSRSQRFQACKRGLEIVQWIDEMREFFREGNEVVFPEVPSLDPDNGCLADKLEDISEGA
ncbi:MAG TPA: hypothetical protein VFR05_09715 [Terriglobia bacterium]|nr:hypothetical protein [Terriglobia bacterium]